MSYIGEGAGALSTQQRRAMAALMTGVVLVNLDAAIANTALPTIAGDHHAAAATSVWVVNAYQLAMVAALLPFAAWGDIIGHRRIYIGGCWSSRWPRWPARCPARYRSSPSRAPSRAWARLA